MAERDLTLKFKVTDEGTIVLDKISQKITGMDKSVKQVSSSLSLIKWDSIVNLGARAIHAGEQVYDFAKSVASSANEIQRQAEIMGVSTDVYQKLAYAAKMADVSNEEFAMGMKFLARSIEEAKTGTGNAGQYFKALGIDVDKLSNEELGLEQMTYRLADAFKSVQDGTGKTDTAIGLLGRAGQKLVPLLNQGSEGMKQFGEEAVRMGSVLGEVTLTKGGEAEKTFKQLETTINSLKISLAPAAGVVAGFFKDQVDNWTWLVRHIVEKISGPEVKGMFFKTVDELLAYSKKMAEGPKKIIDPKQFADPEGIKRAQSLMHEWLSEYQIDIDELNQSMSVLGTKSTQSLVVGIKDAENAVTSITAKFIAGKISVLDYGNAIQVLTKQYQAFTGGDVTKQLVDLEEKTSEAMKAVDKNMPDWQKQMAKITDAWIEERNKIQEKSPAYIRANLSKWEEDLREAKRQYDAFATSIQPVSITGAYGGGGSSPPVGQYGGSWDADLKNKLQYLPSSYYATSLAPPKGDYGGSWDANLTNKLVNYEFTATGMSPKMPLGDALRKLADKFGGIESMISGLEADISFDKFTMEMKKLTDQMAEYEKVRQNWNYLASGPMASLDSKMYGYDKKKMAQLNALEADLQAQIDLLEKEQSLSFLKGYVGSYQHGTTYVPKTGLALVHEGEKIISKNVRYGDSSIIFNISGSDPKKIADEVSKVLKYRRSSQLRESING